MSIKLGLDMFQVESKVGWSMFSESMVWGSTHLLMDLSTWYSGGRAHPHKLPETGRSGARPPEYEFNRGSTEYRGVERFYKLGDLSKYNGTEILNSFLTRVAASCDLGPEELCTPQLSGLQDIRITNSTIPTIVYSVGSYCNISEVAANGDIAGPGVVISYIIQSVLAMTSWFMAKFFVSWPRRLMTYPLYLFIDSQEDREAHVEKAKRSQALISNSRPGVAFLSVFGEFQEAQIFFPAAIQVATYSMLYTQDGVPRDDGSWAQMRLDSLLAQSLAVVRTSPVLIVQAGLQHAEYHWWYLHIGTTIVSVLSVIVTFYALFIKDSPEVFQQDLLPACGNNLSPLKYCIYEVNKFRFDDYLFGTEALTRTYHLPMIGLLLADQIIWLFKDRVRRRLVSQTTTYRSKRLFGSIWKGIVNIVWCGIAVFQFFLLVAIGKNIQYLRDTLKLYSDGSSLGTWSFGQLIAVLIWAPMISKHIYYNIFGLEAGLEERISRAYAIVRKPDVAKTEVASTLDAEESKYQSANAPAETDSFITKQATDSQLGARSSPV